MAATPLETEALIVIINEFYGTNDEGRRHEIDQILCAFKTNFECIQTVGACMRLISQPTSSPSVKYFGAVTLYDVIRSRSTECLENQTLQLSLKTFLIDSLTSGAYAQTTSVLNKLSASLALFALHCIPDLWTAPVQDLTPVLAGTPEILLKVLADMAAEFSHVSMPLSQRSKLKGELHKFSESIIQVLAVVLRGGDTSSITKQAAVECVEQWLQLPGMALDQWTHVLSDVLGAVVQDCTALASILDIIAENDEFTQYSTLIISICQYICVNVSVKIEEELGEDATSEEIATLVAATCSVAEKSVPTLVECAIQGGDSELIIQLSRVMQVLANMKGQFPQEEYVSDIPSAYFITLRTEMSQSLNSSNSKVNPQFVSQIAQVYANILDTAITKLTYPRVDQFRTWNLEEREQFESYRKTRSETSYDSYSLSSGETLNFLNGTLEEALKSGDVNRSEACLYQWECVGDYLAESDYPSIFKCLEICASGSLSAIYSSNKLDYDLDRRGATLMRLLYALSHLIQEHDQAQELECALIPVILTYLSTKNPSVQQTIETLQKFTEDRREFLDVIGEQISSICYDFFISPDAKDSERLAALKCIGYVLSRRKPSETMGIVGRILEQQNINEPGIDADTRNHRFTFQINIFSVLFSSLSNKNKNSLNDEEPAIVQLLREAIPVFETLCNGSLQLERKHNTALMQEVCRAVRSALTFLPDQYLPSFFPFVTSLIDATFLIPETTTAACLLAKSTVLQCGPLVGVEMANAVAHWIKSIQGNLNSQNLEDYLELIYHIVKKNWKLIRKQHEPSMVAFESTIQICNHIFAASRVPTETRSAAQIMSILSAYTTSNDDVAMKSVFAQHGEVVVKTVFARIQGELMRPTVEALADVLLFYLKQFTEETGKIINQNMAGGSALVGVMFREIGNPRNFRQAAIRFNLAAVRDPKFTSEC